MRGPLAVALLATVVLGGAAAYALAADKAAADQPKPSTDPLVHLNDLLKSQAPCSEIRAALDAIPLADIPHDVLSQIEHLCPKPAPAPKPQAGTPAAAPAPVVNAAQPIVIDTAALEEKLAELLLLPDPSVACAEMNALVAQIEAAGGVVPDSVKAAIAGACPPDKGTPQPPNGWVVSYN